MSKKTNEKPIIKSSAIEYLTYVASIGNTPKSYEIRNEDENIWLSQNDG